MSFSCHERKGNDDLFLICVAFGWIEHKIEVKAGEE